MASINNLAATGDVFVKVGPVYAGLEGTTQTTSTSIVDNDLSIFRPVPSDPTKLVNYAIQFGSGGPDPKMQGKIKVITAVDNSGTEVTVTPNFEVPAGTPYKIHTPYLSVTADGINLHGLPLQNPGAGGGGASFATEKFVNDSLFSGRMIVWNHMQVWEPNGTKEYPVIVNKTDSDPNGKPGFLNIESSMVTVGTDILEPYAHYNIENNSSNTGSKIVFTDSYGIPAANVVARATMGATENMNAGIEHIQDMNEGESQVVLPFSIYDDKSLFVTVDGVVQSSQNYSLASSTDSKLNTINFSDTFQANNVVRVVNLKGAAFLGNYESSITLKNDTPMTMNEDGTVATTLSDAVVNGQFVYEVDRTGLVAKGMLNLYVATDTATVISLPQMTKGQVKTPDDGIRIKVIKANTCPRVIIAADTTNFFHYEGQIFGQLTNDDGIIGKAECSDTDKTSKLDFEWDAAYNTWVINQGIGTWTVNRDT